MVLPRPRLSLLSKRVLLASALVGASWTPAAIADSPLRVASQAPVLLEPSSGKPVTGTRKATVLAVEADKPAAASTAPGPASSPSDRVARLPESPITAPRSASTTSPAADSTDGWIAREHVNQRQPLSDPPSLPAIRSHQSPLAGLNPVPLSSASTVEPDLVLSLQPADGPRSARDAAVHVAPEAEVRVALEPVESSLPVRRPVLAEDNEGSDFQPDTFEDDELPMGVYIGDLNRKAAEKTHVDELKVDPLKGREAPQAERYQPEPVVIGAAAQRMRQPIETTLAHYFQRPEIASQRSSWGMMHSIMAFGIDTQVISGRKRFNAIAWLAGNNVCRGQRMFTVDRDGLAPKQGVGLQGHQAQMLAVLGLVGVPESYPLHSEGHEFSVAELIQHEQRACRSGAELTFTLIGLAHYLDTDAQWLAGDGEKWDFERLIQEELDQQVIGAACGGTHRLMGLSHALRIRREQGREMTGQWARADEFIKDFVDYAWKLQNPDGSMSTEWFEGRGDRSDVDRKVQTTGHIVEWLIGVSSDQQLQDPRMMRAVSFLTNSMYRYRTKDWSVGPKGHALRSLALYHQRLFDAGSPWTQAAVARGHQRSSQHRH